eukprot:8568520-Prorocentrum_lima.AAC.1
MAGWSWMLSSVLASRACARYAPWRSPSTLRCQSRSSCGGVVLGGSPAKWRCAARRWVLQDPPALAAWAS